MHAIEHKRSPSYSSSSPNDRVGGRFAPALPLLSASLRVSAEGGIARVVLEQRFVNRYAEPLRATYTLPLPADAAVSGYAFTLGDRRIVGEIDRRAAARERYERALIEGQTASVLDEERSALFTQELGNIPPHAEIVVEITLDQRLRWLEEGAWEWRFPMAAAPRYLGAEGRVADASRVAVDAVSSSDDLAFNPMGFGFPSPLESDVGWGGGGLPWDILRGKTSFPDTWAHGLAFTGGREHWCGQPPGRRQATVDFGEPKRFNRVLAWHHGDEHIPRECHIEIWNGETWVDAGAVTTLCEGMRDPHPNGGGGSVPTESVFPPVIASKVRFVIDSNHDITHGWLYALQVFSDAEIGAEHEHVASGPPTVQLSLHICDALANGSVPQSPSHELRRYADAAAQRVALGGDGRAPLDRDVVVRWQVGTRDVGLTMELARPDPRTPALDASYALITLVPPIADRDATFIARDLILLLDTSGSMQGMPLDQSRRVASALVDSLSPHDRLEMVSFSTSAQRFRTTPVAATHENKRTALSWLRALRAGGGTEMRTGVLEAMRGLRADAQRQIVLVTDGLIGFESELVRAILERLPRSSRLHTVGVGSAVNRSLTAAAARAGRGVEVIIGLGEDPEPAAQRVLARTRAPVLVDIELSGQALLQCAPQHIPDVYSGAPLLISAKLRPEGGELILRGRTERGGWHERIHVPPMSPGVGRGAVVALFGREAVEDYEMEIAGGADHRSVDRAIERIGLDFGISTRLTSWVAVSEEQTVDPSAPTRRERIPQALPFGLSAEALGLRGAPVQRQVAQARSTQIPSGTTRERLRRKVVTSERSEAPVYPSAPVRPMTPPTPAPAPSIKRGEFLDDLAVRQVVRISGRVVLSRDGELIIEATLASDRTWACPSEVVILAAAGAISVAAVDPARSTHSGPLSAGMTVRLVLTFSGPPPIVKSIRFDTAAGTVEVLLEGG